MAHAGHPASDGPSAKRWMASEGTGMSDETAAFVAANCSPFTHPTQMPAEPKVVDTKATIKTCTAYITEHFQIPVVRNASTLANSTRGDQLIIMNANPLAALPVTWHEAPKYQASPKYRMDPGVWNKRYEDVGLTNISSQARNLCDNSLKHRVVGCGLKAWVSQDTNLSRGTIEGGLFDPSEARQATVVQDDLSMRYNALTDVTVVGGHQPLGRAFIPQNAGYLGEALVKDDIQAMRMCIRNAKTQQEGLLAADKGCSVRWVPIDDFKFTQSVNRNVVIPCSPLFSNGTPTGIVNPSSVSTGQPVCRILDRTAVQDDRPDGIVNNFDLGTYFCPAVVPAADPTAIGYGLGSQPPSHNAAGSPIASMNAITETGTVRQCWNAGATSTYVAATNAGPTYMFGTADLDYYPGSYIDLGDPAMKYTDPDANFENSLYLDISGVDPDQFLDVQVVWHIEYIPKEYSMDCGIASPIDVNWPTIQAMVTNSEAFPIVVEGHSFFSSLWAGVKKAGGVIGGILRGASSIASAIPDPRAQAFGAGAGVVGGVMGKIF